MSFHRLVLLSSPEPTCSARDVLDVCHAFPDRLTQAGIGGRLISVRDQFVLLLEGQNAMVERLAQRIVREVPEAEMTVRVRETSEDRAFWGWSIEDLYLDEIERDDPAAAERLGDGLIDLFAGVTEDVDEDEAGEEGAEQRDPFAEVAALVQRPARPRQAVLAAV